MKPSKTITERVVWLTVHTDNHILPLEIELDPILEKVKRSECTPDGLKLIVSQDYSYGGVHGEDCILIVSDVTKENPEYDLQMEEYEHRIAQQKAEKLAEKNKAKQELMDRIAKIDKEIEQLNDGVQKS